MGWPSYCDDVLPFEESGSCNIKTATTQTRDTVPPGTPSQMPSPSSEPPGNLPARSTPIRTEKPRYNYQSQLSKAPKHRTVTYILPKPTSVPSLLLLLSASSPAFLAKAPRSAPVYPSVQRATSSSGTSGERAMVRARTRSIDRRSGRQCLPVRKIDGSMTSGWFVAASITTLCSVESRISSSSSQSTEKQPERIRVTDDKRDRAFLPSSPLVSLRPNSASSSSRNNTHGLHRRATLKVRTIAFSDSPICASGGRFDTIGPPTSPLTRSGIDTAKKLAEDSVATALASRVLPVPGGPYLRSGRGDTVVKHGNMGPVPQAEDGHERTTNRNKIKNVQEHTFGWPNPEAAVGIRMLVDPDDGFLEFGL
ncbi:hypothetical protein BC938DRAFT_481190 [Jimgerdemannia flammicorona]|uniref:Uncharacterized protein n=1 Tax=Jimgerdemannia flammicorona TaxID=994334 RepID=A0A433QGR4_9FUNG|nr:hypothetical protein BC938DRAFT_481190 [Jimgerdemannia flammicorona]